VCVFDLECSKKATYFKWCVFEFENWGHNFWLSCRTGTVSAREGKKDKRKKNPAGRPRDPPFSRDKR
jgi:hypothetical protein